MPKISKNMIATETKINPQMISLARESRGLTQKELADLMNVSAGKLCRVEQDDQSFSDDMLNKLCEVLKYPHNFFFQEGEGYLTSSINFRKREKVAQKLMMPIEAQINIYRLNIETLIDKINFTEFKLPVFDIDKQGSAREAARKLRKMWKLPHGPIENVTELLEAHGIIIVSFDFKTERVDSRTILTKHKQPVVVINKTMLGDRQRFSLAYELGHIIMHAFTLASFDSARDIDHEANLFAAEFLMPENDIRKDMEVDIDMAKLAELKRKWKASMQSLLYCASDMELISYNQKRYLLGIFHSQKLIRREPVELDVPKEKPRLLRDLITKFKNAHKFSINELARSFHLEQEEFMGKYGE
jgi:Zn-dependent peptidase ImmA (M78 family)/DNA-binding transcriptional regulator YiaG